MRAFSPWATVYLLVQVVVPLGAWVLGSQYFGWAMFSQVTFPPKVVIVAPGVVDTVPVRRYFGFFRGDLSYSSSLGPQICRLEPNASAIRIIMNRGDTRETRCR